MSQVLSLAKDDRTFDLCSIFSNKATEQTFKEVEEMTYEFSFDQFLFQITFLPIGDDVKCILTSRLSYLPFTVENVGKRFFYLQLLKIVCMKKDVPIIVRNERYISFESCWIEKRPITLEKLAYRSLERVMKAKPYMELFKQ